MCTNLPGGRSVEEGAILGRTTELSATVNSKIDHIISEIGLDRANFRYIDHSMEKWVKFVTKFYYFNYLIYIADAFYKICEGIKKLINYQ